MHGWWVRIPLSAGYVAVVCQMLPPIQFGALWGFGDVVLMNDLKVQQSGTTSHDLGKLSPGTSGFEAAMEAVAEVWLWLLGFTGWFRRTRYPMMSYFKWTYACTNGTDE